MITCALCSWEVALSVGVDELLKDMEDQKGTRNQEKLIVLKLMYEIMKFPFDFSACVIVLIYKKKFWEELTVYFNFKLSI